MIRSGISALRMMQYEILADTVSFRHGLSAKEIRAIAGKTVFRSTNEYGNWVRTETRDFIIRADQLDAPPERGDVIVFDGREFEVLAPNDEPVWRWSDPYHTAYRVHTKNTGGDE